MLCERQGKGGETLAMTTIHGRSCRCRLQRNFQFRITLLGQQPLALFLRTTNCCKTVQDIFSASVTSILSVEFWWLRFWLRRRRRDPELELVPVHANRPINQPTKQPTDQPNITKRCPTDRQTNNQPPNQPTNNRLNSRSTNQLIN